MTSWDKADYLDALQSDATAFRAAATPDTLDSPVPPCPDWTVKELVVHLGSVHRWIAGLVKRGGLDRPERFHAEPGKDEVLGFFDGAYADLAATLRSTPADSPAWNWAPQPKTALFWARRAALETAVHRWDAQVAAGVTEPIATELAADGVDEVLDAWLPAGRGRGPKDLTGLVHLIAADSGTEWFVRLRGERVSMLDAHSVDPEESPVSARATGQASDLMLALWGRIPFDMLSVEGDEALLSALRTG